MKHVLFVADLHLTPENSNVCKAFLQFLRSEIFAADALYILGDFFSHWPGDDCNYEFVKNLKSKLKALTEHGKPIFIMPGNRDFLLGEKFAKDTGSILLHDPTLINLYGRKTLLSHGYILGPKKLPHTILCKFVKNKFFRKIFFILPRRLRKYIVWQEHACSYMFEHKTPEQLISETENTVEKLLREVNVNQIIHGHVHHELVRDFKIDAKNARQIALGGWKHGGSVLVYYADHHCEFLIK